MKRKKTKLVFVGDVAVGGDARVSVQSMACTRTEDVKATVEQIQRLEDAGCEIVRVAVPNQDAAEALGPIKKQIRIPLVADIHFNHEYALTALDRGVDKIRINPGNIGSKDRVKAVLKAAKERGVPIRIGVNAGSLEKDVIEKYGITARAMVKSALRHVRLCEDMHFEDIIISLKASDVPLMIEANRRLSKKVDYPLHLGVTEAGTPKKGILRSSVGIGTLLAEGIGDTIRVSLTGDPVEEVAAGFEILKSLKLREHGLTIISCPTCGRLQTNLVPIVEEVERRLANIDKPMTVAIMGCSVNGPGEAREAYIGVACGKASALLFRKGETIRKLQEDEIVDTIVNEVNVFVLNNEGDHVR